MKVDFSPAAAADLEGIADWIAMTNPARALRVSDELLAACENLVHAPRAFPLVPRYEALGVRRRVCGNYLIFYQIEDSAVIVLHILHGARDYEALFGDGDD